MNLGLSRTSVHTQHQKAFANTPVRRLPTQRQQTAPNETPSQRSNSPHSNVAPTSKSCRSQSQFPRPAGTVLATDGATAGGRSGAPSVHRRRDDHRALSLGPAGPGPEHHVAVPSRPGGSDGLPLRHRQLPAIAQRLRFRAQQGGGTRPGGLAARRHRACRQHRWPEPRQRVLVRREASGVGAVRPARVARRGLHREDRGRHVRATAGPRGRADGAAGGAQRALWLPHALARSLYG